MKNKNAFCLLVTLVIILCFPSMVCAESYYPYEKLVKITVGKKAATVNESQILMDEAPYIKNGRTLVPLRFLSEALGAQVKWDNSTQTATVYINNFTLKVIVNWTTAYFDDVEIKLDVPAEIKNGRVFVPLRFFAEETRAFIEYDNSTQTITMVALDKTGWKSIEGYNYPNDWQGELKGAMLHFTSPKGSQAWFQPTEEDLESAISDMIFIVEENGYVLQSQEHIYPNVPDLGEKLLFYKFDQEKRPIAKYIVIIDQIESGVLIKEVYIPIDVYPYDMPVMDTLQEYYMG